MYLKTEANVLPLALSWSPFLAAVVSFPSDLAESSHLGYAQFVSLGNSWLSEDALPPLLCCDWIQSLSSSAQIIRSST